MKIELLENAKFVKNKPYKLSHKYKDIVKEIDDMLIASIIYPVDQFEWANVMVVQPKKHDTKKI